MQGNKTQAAAPLFRVSAQLTALARSMARTGLPTPRGMPARLPIVPMIAQLGSGGVDAQELQLVYAQDVPQPMRRRSTQLMVDGLIYAR